MLKYGFDWRNDGKPVFILKNAQYVPVDAVVSLDEFLN